MLRPASSSASFVRSVGSARSTGPHLDDDSVLVGEPVGQRPQHVLAPGRDDQVMPSRGELGGQRFADVLRSTCDDCAGIRAGSGYWHGPDYIVGDHGRSAAAWANRWAVAGAGLGAVGRRCDGRERDRRDVRVLGLPDRAPSATTYRARPRRRVGCSGRWHCLVSWWPCSRRSPGSGSTRRGGDVGCWPY